MTFYLRDRPNGSGAYPAPQSHPGPGTIPIRPDQRDMVVKYNGFVTVETQTDSAGAIAYIIVPNTKGWEAWKTEHPEGQGPVQAHTLDERVGTLEDDTKELQEALDMILTGVTE